VDLIIRPQDLRELEKLVELRPADCREELKERSP
jgi:hypothetical protein